MADKLMMGRRSFVKGGLAASALTALAACGKKSGSGKSGSNDGSMKFYINDPVAIDPYNTQESEGTQVEHILFDSLCDYDWDKEEVVPKRHRVHLPPGEGRQVPQRRQGHCG